jgi:hypothetical protein
LPKARDRIRQQCQVYLDGRNEENCSRPPLKYLLEHDQALTLTEKYVLLAALHDAGCTGEAKLGPLTRLEGNTVPHEELKNGIRWVVVQDWLGESYRGHAQSWLADVRADLQAKLPPVKPSQRKRRRRPSARKPTPLTPAQAEAMHLVGEHKGNFAAAARAAGKSPTMMRKLYQKATAKLGKKAIKHATQRLPTDSRGQETIAAHEEE